MKCSLLFAFLVLLAASVSAQVVQDQAETKRIEIAKSGFSSGKDKQGTPGIRFTISGQVHGLRGKPLSMRTTIKLPGGKSVKATGNAPKGAIKKDGTLQWTTSLNVDKNTSPFNFWTFIPFNAMNLPPGIDRVVIRGRVHSGNICSYYDGEVKISGSDVAFSRGVMFGALKHQQHTREFVQPNVAGMGVETANIVKKSHHLSFSSVHNATGLKGQPFFSGISFKLPNGKHLKASPACPNRNIGSAGQAQFQRSEKVADDKVNWRAKGIDVRLAWLDIDPKQNTRVIAVYYVSCANLWNVREFEMIIPVSKGPSAKASGISPNEANGGSLDGSGTSAFDLFRPVPAGSPSETQSPDGSGSARVVSPGSPGSSSSAEIARRRKDVTNFTAPLRALLRELKNIDQGLNFQRKTSDQPNAKVKALGARLVRAGRTYMQIFRKAGPGRFGTLEEIGLIDKIKATHEMAAKRLYDLYSVDIDKLRADVEKNNGRTNAGRAIFSRVDGWKPLGFIKATTTLQAVAKTMLEGRVVDWMESEGLGEILTPKGRNLLGQEVGKNLQLDLKGFIDRRSREVLGMPLGGLTSMKAAMRLQTRHQAKRVMTKLILNYTGNELVVTLLSKTIVRWLENDLWPMLRESMRNKGNLDKRTRITLRTIRTVRQEYNKCFGPGKDPKNVDAYNTFTRLKKRRKAIYAAARYLRKDIKRASRDDLATKLDAAFRELKSFIEKRVHFQLLVHDDEFWSELQDKLLYTKGIHLDVVLLMSLDSSPPLKMTVKVEKKGRSTDIGSVKTIDTARLFSEDMRMLTRLSFYIDKDTAKGIEPGVKRFQLRANNRHVFNIYWIHDRSTYYFTAKLPLLFLQGERVTLEIISLDTPMAPIVWTGKIESGKMKEVQKSRSSIAANIRKMLPQFDKELGKFDTAFKISHNTSISVGEIAKLMCVLGMYNDATGVANVALRHYARAARLGGGNFNRHAEMISILAYAAAMNGNHKQYMQYKNQELAFIDRNAGWMKSKNIENSIQAFNACQRRWETAEQILVFTGDEKIALQYFQKGWQMYQALGRTKNPVASTMSSSYPALSAILYKKGIDRQTCKTRVLSGPR